LIRDTLTTLGDVSARGEASRPDNEAEPAGQRGRAGRTTRNTGPFEITGLIFARR
jgi:hypothetical protein